MSVPIINLEIDQGDDEVLRATTTVPTDPTNPASPREPANLTGCTLRFAIRTSAAVAPLLTKSSGLGGGITIEDQTNPGTKGKVTIAIAAAETAALDAKFTNRDLRWELEAIDTGNKTTTLAKGKIVINRDLV